VRRNRKVKILATLGPASSTPEMIEKLFLAGADVFRINMSHTSHEKLRELHGSIREVERKLNRPIGILADLQGPKIRIDTFREKEVVIAAGDRFVFDTNPEPGDRTRVHLPHPEIFASVKVGDFLLLNDGRLRVEVVAANQDRIETMVIFGGALSNRKGVNLPNTLLPIAALTEKDRADLEAAASTGVEWIALSFVQRPEDVAEAVALIKGRAGTIAKMEKPSALLSLDEILATADGIMVARGDLGVELPLEMVPSKQKQLTRAARKIGKPVIVATQMLESMIVEPVPTRAEVSDVATAVYEGADAIMLSAESAAGAWPEKAVAMMDRIAQSAEGDSYYRGIMNAQRNDPQPTTSDAISAAARAISETLQVAAIVSYTESGSTAMRVARERPNVPIITLTPIPATARRLALAWGQHCLLAPNADDLEHMIEDACRFAYREGFAALGERIIITVGVPLGKAGATNMLRVAVIDKRHKD
jgi:pyruvate kinase